MQNIILESYLNSLNEEYFILNELKLNDFTIDKIQKSFKHNLKTSEDFLKNRGINIDIIKNEAKKLKSSFIDMMDSNINPEDASKKISSELSNFIIDNIKKFNIKPDEKQNPSLMKKLVLTYIILNIVVFLNTLFLTVMAEGFFIPPEKAFALTAIVFAPIIEETGKAIALRSNFPYLYTGIFSFFEGLQYVIMLAVKGANIPLSILMRAVTVLMHFSTTIIQKYFYDKFGSESNMTKVSWVIAVLLHSGFNSLGLIYNNKIKNFVGL